MPQAYPGLGEAEYLFIGVLSSLLLFISVLVHELAHSIIAKRNGLRIKQITLFLFGGVSEMEEEPDNPSLELRMSAAGPVTSVVIALASGLAWQAALFLKSSALIQAPLEYTTLVNEIVAAFNLIPAFPLDGGRIFRSLIWMRNKDMLRATRTASNVGRGVAYLLMFLGIYLMFTVDLLTGFWFILIGWFISSGAQTGLGQAIIQESLAGVKAAEVMTRSVDSVSPDQTLTELAEEFQRTKHNGFPVVSNNDMQGCVTIEDLRKMKRDTWSTAKVRDIMTPKEKLITMKEEEGAIRALALMSANRIGRVFVTDRDGRLVGIITRSDIIKTVKVRESMLGLQTGVKTAEAEGRVFGVEKGMFFIIEQPAQEGFEWNALFDETQFRLTEEKVAVNEAGKQVKKFTFQALKPGTYNITLALKAAVAIPEVGKQPPRMPSKRGIQYTIVVS